MRSVPAIAMMGILGFAPAMAAPPPAPALRLVEDPASLATLKEAVARRDANLLTALDRSLAWFDAAESHAFFPRRDIDVDHARARAGVAVFRDLISRIDDDDQLAAELHRRFNVYAAAGVDDDGEMLVTAYYAPEHEAAREPHSPLPVSAVRAARGAVRRFARPDRARGAARRPRDRVAGRPVERLPGARQRIGTAPHAGRLGHVRGATSERTSGRTPASGVS